MKKQKLIEMTIVICIIAFIVFIFAIIFKDKIQIIEIEDCEYIIVEGYYSNSIVHKENCKSHIHRKHKNED